MPLAHPLKGVPNPREVVAWGMYDLANQSFQLLINTLLFAIYFPKVVVGDEDRGRILWGVLIVVANVLVVIASPIAGAIADNRAWKRKILLGSGVGAVALMFAFPFLGPGMVVLAGVLYVSASFLVGIGENFLGSFLPEIATAETMGRVSALGWTMSYIGALLLLIVTGAAMFLFGLTEAEDWRYLFLFAAIWFLVGMVPAFVSLRERSRPQGEGAGATLVGGSFRRLGQTIRHARKFRHLLRFLLAFFIYSMGTQTVVFFAGLIGDGLGFGIRQLVLLALVMTVGAGAGAIFAARYQDRLGHRRTVTVFLAVWIVSTLAMALTQVADAPVELFWPIAFGIGIGLGGIGTGSRAMVGYLTPAARAGEFFGLWGMVYKLASVGALGFGLASAKLGGAGLFLITAFFAAGLVLLMFVREDEGRRAAVESEAGAGGAVAL
jgi:UMF1 family MFS transporter